MADENFAADFSLNIGGGSFPHVLPVEGVRRQKLPSLAAEQSDAVGLMVGISFSPPEQVIP